MWDLVLTGEVALYAWSNYPWPTIVSFQVFFSNTKEHYRCIHININTHIFPTPFHSQQGRRPGQIRPRCLEVDDQHDDGRHQVRRHAAQRHMGRRAARWRRLWWVYLFITSGCFSDQDIFGNLNYNFCRHADRLCWVYLIMTSFIWLIYLCVCWRRLYGMFN